jgi:hypothetical protein
MRVKLSDLYKQECHDRFRLKFADVKATVTSPAAEQTIIYERYCLSLFLSSELDDGSFILAIADFQQDTLTIQLAFRLLPDIITDLKSSRPLGVLKILVDRFGIPFTIGTETKKLFIKEEIALADANPAFQQLFTVPHSLAHSGILFASIRPASKPNNPALSCCLAFCIDSHLYTSWIFGWKPPAEGRRPWDSLSHDASGQEAPLEQYELTAEEKAKARETVLGIMSEGHEGFEEAVRFRGACMLLSKAFGRKYYLDKFSPASNRADEFLPTQPANDLEASRYCTRIVQLADYIYGLRNVPGISLKIDEINKDPAKSIESIWFEFFVPSLIDDSGSEILQFVPRQGTKTPDLLVRFRADILAIEVKTKEADTPFSPRAINNSLRDAYQQLPQSGPGAIFLMVHPHWLVDDDFLNRAEAVFTRSLNRNRNCNAIFIYWPSDTQLPEDSYLSTWRFKCFSTWTPRTPIAKIHELVSIADHIDPIVRARFTDN